MRITGFGVALQSYPVRDALWLAIDDGRLRGIELWVNLARRLPSPYDAAPLFLAAWASYLPRAPARADRCAAAPGFDGFHTEVHDQIAEGDKGRHPQDTPWQEHRLLDGHPPTGRDVAIEVIDVVRVAGGQVVEHWNVADQLGWMCQLGVIG